MEEKILIKKKANRTPLYTTYFCILISIVLQACFYDEIVIGVSFFIVELICLALAWGLSNSACCCKIVVTDKRIYGMASKRKRFDILLEDISYVNFSIISSNNVRILDIRTKEGGEYIFWNFREGEEICEFLNANCEMLIKQREKDEAHEFYKACKEKNIDYIKNSQSMEIATLIAKNMGIKCDKREIVKLYEKGEKIELSLIDAKKAHELEKAKNDALWEEEYCLKEHKKYIDLKGKAKLKQYLLGFRAVHEKSLNSPSDNNAAGISAFVDAIGGKERDWAIAGGIASGLAGGAAGVATAMEIQAHNAAVRADRDAALQFLAITTMPTGYSYNPKEEIERIDERLKKLETLLVDENPTDNLLDLLGLKVVKLERSPTGNVRITVSFEKVDDYNKSEHAQFYIDGGFKASLVKGGKVVDTTIFTLPMRGSNGSGKIDSVFTNIPEEIEIKDNTAEKCRIVFEPCHLWAMEVEKN